MNIRGVLITTSLFLGIALVVVSALFFVGYIALSDSSSDPAGTTILENIEATPDASSSATNSVNPLNPLAQPTNSTVQPRRSGGGGGGGGGSSGGSGGTTTPTTPAVDTTSPIVTLTSLGDNAPTSSAFMPAGILRAQITDETALSSAILYVWDATTHQIVAQSSASISGTSANPSFSSFTFPAEGSYKWNIWANDSSGNSASASTNWTIIYSTSAPSTQCNDGIDNDGDLWIDFPNDADCSSASDDDESGSPIYVCTAAQLSNIRNNLAGDYVQTCDISLSGVSWTPIGMDANGNSVAFTGSYNGNGHVITDLYIELEADGIQTQNTDELGLFARLSGAEITSAVLGEVTIVAGPGTAGALAGTSYDSKFDGIVVVDANIDGTLTSPSDMSVIGGIVGISSGSAFENVFLQNIGVKGGRVGGIIGHILSLPSFDYQQTALSTIDASAITVEGAYAGGIVGSMDGALGAMPSSSHSFNMIRLNSDVVCSSKPLDTIECNAGGLGGLMQHFNAEDVRISGSVTNGEDKAGIVGGFAGTILGGYTSITNAHSLSLIEGNSEVGGFAGFIDGGNDQVAISESSARGNVQWNANGNAVETERGAGGFVGSVDNLVIISQSFSEGSVIGKDFAAGFIGIVRSGSPMFTDVYTTSNVNGDAYPAGFVSVPEGLIIDKAYAAGNVNGNGAGGFSSVEEGGSLSNCYWNTETSGLSLSEACIGLKTADMFKEISYPTWDFNNVWKSNDGLDYPRFAWEATINLSPFDGEGNFVQRNFGMIMIIHIVLFVLLLIALIVFYYRSRRETSTPLTPAPTMTPSRPLPPSSPAPSQPMQPRPSQPQVQVRPAQPQQSTLNFRTRPIQFGQAPPTDSRNKKI